MLIGPLHIMFGKRRLLDPLPIFTLGFLGFCCKLVGVSNTSWVSVPVVSQGIAGGLTGSTRQVHVKI